ncbi:hypothetical protein Mapa_007364 [Marchantia paleacea]|nr:hypothetical protein Mapa_007364 [Marchantia paleacea]
MQGGLRAFAKRVAAVPRFPSVQTRRMAGEPGAREKALLAEDPALKEFQSTKGTIQMIKRFGDVLVMAVVAGKVLCMRSTGEWKLEVLRRRKWPPRRLYDFESRRLEMGLHSIEWLCGDEKVVVCSLLIQGNHM